MGRVIRAQRKGQFRDPYCYKTVTETFIAAEGVYSGQFIYC